MGTNYYVEAEPPCPTCGHGKEPLHIGKQSGGWAFLFAPYPDIGLTCWSAWKAYLSNRRIVDEYGEEHPLDKFEAMILASRGGLCAETASADEWGPFGRDRERKDAEGYRFSDTADFS